MAAGDPLHSKKHFSFATILLPTIGNIIFVALLFVLVFNSGNGLLGDGDSGYHIRTGELILKEWRIPALDPYSYHVPPLQWTAHEWLAEVIMATIHSVSGLTGIVLFFAVLLALIHWCLYRILREAIEGHHSLHDYYIACRRDVFQPLARSTSCFLALLLTYFGIIF